MTFNLNEKQQTYLQEKMNAVSRSFALVAPTVEAPLNDYLATAYLICRVVDNIEDCTQEFSWQQARFTEFATLLQNPVEAKKILYQWERESWPGLSPDEQNMMSTAGGLSLWQIYTQIPDESRSSIAHWAQVMADGMEKVNNPDLRNVFFKSREGVRLPAKETDYDQYCFYVAGTVGHMITEMAIHHYAIDDSTADRLLVNSEASGRALQKTNIVKDFAEDLNRGACYLPDEWLNEANYAPLRLEGASLTWTKMVIDNVLQEFENSVKYVLDLPVTAAGFRKASLLMLLPGYQTLLLAARKHQQLFTPDHKIKISRVTMTKCLLDARQMVNSNKAILAYSRSIQAELGKILDYDKIRMTIN